MFWIFKFLIASLIFFVIICCDSFCSSFNFTIIIFCTISFFLYFFLMSCFRIFSNVLTFVSLSVLSDALTFVLLSALMLNLLSDSLTNASSDLLSDSLLFCCFSLFWSCSDELLEVLELKSDWLQKMTLRVFFKFLSS